MVSCTDLEVEQDESVDSPGFEGVSDPDSFISGIYGGLNGRIGDQANLFAISEVTTDEFLIPTRGSDWGDNGIWRQLHQHNWQNDHAFITNTWNQWNQTHFAATASIVAFNSGFSSATSGCAFLKRSWILGNFRQLWTNSCKRS